MKFEIVQILSGKHANFYTVKIVGEKLTLFEKFISENETKHTNELNDIRNRIQAMANKTGAREQFFKIDEGKPGDGVCALYDIPGKHIRLYCIRYGAVSVILGSGGEKSKKIKALQESAKLKQENELLRKISVAITKALTDGIIEWSHDGMDLLSDDDSIIIEI